jgi:hypothetical protein
MNRLQFKPMLPNKPRGVVGLTTVVSSMASSGSCALEHLGVICPRCLVCTPHATTASSVAAGWISRKAIAQGRPCVSAKPVCLRANPCCIYRTQDRGCGAHPVFPAPSDFEGKVFCQNFGQGMPRERSLIFSCHHPRMRVIQYSRDASDRNEKPRRTGSPGQAGRRQSCVTR